MPLIELEPPSVLPRGQWMRPSGAAGAGLGGVVPVHHRMAQQLQHAGGDVDPGVAVGRAGLQQDDARAGLAQAAGDDAAGRAGADDDVVRFHPWPLVPARRSLRGPGATLRPGRRRRWRAGSPEPRQGARTWRPPSPAAEEWSCREPGANGMPGASVGTVIWRTSLVSRRMSRSGRMAARRRSTRGMGGDQDATAGAARAAVPAAGRGGVGGGAGGVRGGAPQQCDRGFARHGGAAGAVRHADAAFGCLRGESRTPTPYADAAGLLRGGGNRR